MLLKTNGCFIFILFFVFVSNLCLIVELWVVQNKNKIILYNYKREKKVFQKSKEKIINFLNFYNCFNF